MIRRRGFLFGLFAAPTAAKQIVEQGMSKGASTPSGLTAAPRSRRDDSPLWRDYKKHYLRAHSKRDRARPNVAELPISIRGKRSWSDAYKAHVAAKEDEAFYALWVDPWGEPVEAVMRATMKKLGVKT